MKTVEIVKNYSLTTLADTINSALSAMPADQRPEAPSRRRIQSVAYSSRGYFEVADSDNHTDYLSVEEAKKLLPPPPFFYRSF